MRRRMRTCAAMLVTASLVTGAATVTHGQDPAVEADPRCQWTTEAPVLATPEGQAADAELRGVCPLARWDWSGTWPLKDKLKQAYFVPGVGAGGAPQTQIMGMGFGTVRFGKGGATKAFGNLKKRDHVVVLNKPNKPGVYRVVFIYTRDTPGAADGGSATYHIAGDLDGDKTNNIATSVAQPSHPFQGTQAVASLIFANDEWAGAYTDFATGGFYNLTAETDFVAWVSPDGVGFVLPMESAPDAFRPVTFSAGADDQPGSLQAKNPPMRVFTDGSGPSAGDYGTYYFGSERDVSGITMNGQDIGMVAPSAGSRLHVNCMPTNADEYQRLQALEGSVDAPAEPALAIQVTWQENDNELELLVPGYVDPWGDVTGPDGGDMGVCIAFAEPFFQPGSETLTRVVVLDAPAGLEAFFRDYAKGLEAISDTTWAEDMQQEGVAQGELIPEEQRWEGFLGVINK